ncbi:MAG TPA: Uma2 family endonuclease [Tepidisphaeraceae bacterium]|jgi:Uma2 family endonuclease
MSIITPIAAVTPEDLLELSDAVRYELVEGQLVERQMGLESSEIAARIIILIGAFLQDRKLGRVFDSEASYQCFTRAPQKVRRPDVSFIRNGRFEDDRLPTGHCRIPPDLAIEVISPNDLAYEIDEKVAEYLQAGVTLVWIVYPSTRTVEIRRSRSSPLGPISHLAGNEVLSGEDVLDGFSCEVARLFA